MKFSLGQPEHGWVDIVITDGEFSLRDHISCTPNDFISEMMDGLDALLTDGSAQSIRLSLEPAFYVIEMERHGEVYSFSIEPHAPRPRGVLHRAEGALGEIILPIFRTLKGFRNQRSDDGHWPQIPPAAFLHMMRAVANARTAEH